MSFVGSNILAGASGQGGSGYAIERSLRFNSGDSAYLSRNFAAGNRKKWTWSGWFKLSKLGQRNYIFTNWNSSGQLSLYFEWTNSDKIRIGEYSSSAWEWQLDSTSQFRDSSAWYHLVAAVDTTQSTASDRVKVYINGEQLTSFSPSNYPSQNKDTYVNQAVEHNIGRLQTAEADFYLADVHFIDGQALAPTDFGAPDDNGVWQPKKFAGTYSLPFNFGNWVSQTTGTPYDSTRALDHVFDGDDNTYAAASTANTINFTLTSPITGITAVKLKLMRDATAPADGLVLNGTDISSNFTAGQTSEQTISATNLTSLTWNTSASNQWWGLYFIKVVKDGVTYELIQQTSNNSFHLDFKDNSSNAALGTDTSGNSNTWTVNNLMASAPGLATANQGMDVVTWTGNGGDRDIGGLAFQPDFVWIKKRNSSSSGDHMLYDVVRGATKVLKSNSTAAEITDASTLDAFNSDGFSIGGGWEVNKSGDTYVAWTWKAGGAASSNTDGTITSSVSANTSYGFSICTYTGTEGGTFGHGLNAAPKFVIVKRLNASADWCLWHTSISNTQYLMLNSTNGINTFNVWGNTSPTSSVVSVSGDSYTGNNGDTYVAYCWSEVAGFSKFGSYTGTGAAGVVVTTGFKPRFILIKNVSTGSDWRIFDTARSPSNPADKLLFPNATDAEKTNSDYNTDITATGFTVNGTHSGLNTNGDTYIYAAYASKPSGEGIDSLRDSPSNAATPTDTGAGGEVVGNYATLNPLAQLGGTLSNGNLHYDLGSGTKFVSGTIAVNSGKYYWEAIAVSGTTNGSVGGRFGFSQASSTLHGENGPFTLTWHSTQGLQTFISGSYAVRLTGTNYADGDTLGCALDADSNIAYFYKNGSLAYTYNFSSLVPAGSQFLTPTCWNGSSGTPVWTYNFGARAFSYSARTNHKCLNTANLPEPTIADGSKYFDTKLYTGNAGTNAQTGLGFSPDLLWLKVRSQAFNHNLFDSVRGNTKHLSSNLTNAEYTESSGRGLTAFDSNGFTLGQDVQGPGSVNASGQTYAGWAWDAGSSNTTIAAGSLNSSAYDQSQTWSSSVTSDNGFAGNSYGATQAFNGTTSGNHTASNSNGTLTFAPNLTIPANSVIEIYAGSGSTAYMDVTVNGVANNSTAGGAFVQINYDNSTTLTSLTITRTGGGNSADLRGLKINGKLLVDPGVSVPNVPSIASTVRANPSAGFSIVSYTGTGANTTFGHGLNAAPEMVIIKQRNGTGFWVVGHKDLPFTSDYYMSLNTSDAVSTGAGGVAWQSTAPTSSVVSIGSSSVLNGSGNTHIAYCFAPVEGYSAMGSYSSGSDPFVFTGFSPRFVLLKKTNAVGHWYMFDSERGPINPNETWLEANGSGAEQTHANGDIRFLSNGFQPIGSDIDAGGGTYIYYAVSENPFKTARAR